MVGSAALRRSSSRPYRLCPILMEPRTRRSISSYNMCLRERGAIIQRRSSRSLTTFSKALRGFAHSGLAELERPSLIMFRDASKQRVVNHCSEARTVPRRTATVYTKSIQKDVCH